VTGYREYFACAMAKRENSKPKKIGRRENAFSYLARTQKGKHTGKLTAGKKAVRHRR